MENSFQRKLDLKLILSVIAAGLMSFTGVVVATAMNVTFPTLMKQFGIGTATVQWITTGYLLMLSVIIPLSSFLKKRFPMKHLFLFAVSVFIIATVMCMLAPTFTVLLLGRLLQGVGAGIALPLMFNIVLEQTPFDKMGFMMGIASLIAAIAPAVGPSFGGLIVNTLGWRMIFAFLLPLLVISLVLGIYAIRQSSATEHVSFDVPGYLLIIIGFFCFIYGINSASKVGWISIRVAVLFLICLAALLLFVHHTKYLEKPLIDLKIFGISKFTFSVLFLILLQFICLGIGFLLPNYSQLVMGENALTAGCILLPGCIIGAVLNPFTGKLLDHCGASLPIFIGTGCALISSLLSS
jgi:DHA2 family lincomycin resistance protein-like MFS transporter